MLANYHTHTKRCRHASGEDREYVEAAIEAGLRILGFSDHCPWVFPRKDFVSGMRLTAGETEGYFYSLECLKKEYAKDIKIYIGFEAEYCPELMEAQTELLSDYPLDYMILGQHFLGPEYEYLYMGQRTEEEERLQRYVDTAIEGLSTGKYLYMAHPDLVNYIGSEEIYHKHIKRLCEALKAADIPVEINMLGLAEGRHYPCEKFLKVAQEVGNKAIIGMDAHAPEQLNQPKTVQKGLELCQKFGLNVVDGDLLK